MKTRLFYWGTFSFLVLWLMSSVLCAQQAKIDSLHACLSSKQLPSEIRVRLLLEISELVYRTDPEYSFSLAKQALPIARKIRDARNEARSLYLMGYCRLVLSQLNSATELINSSMAISTRIRNYAAMADALRCLGYIEKRKGNQDKYVTYLKRSLSVCEQHGYTKGAAQVLMNLGFAATGAEALGYFERSYEKFHQLNDIHSILSVLHVLGGGYYDLQEYERAEQWLLKAPPLIPLAGDDRLVAGCYELLAMTHQQLGKIQTARTYFSNAVDHARLSDDRNLFAECLQKAGVVEYDAGFQVIALRYFSEAREVFSLLNDSARLCELLVNVANCHERLGKNDSAISNYKKGQSIASRIGHIPALLGALEGMSLVYKNLGAAEKAHEMDKQRLTIYENSGEGSEWSARQIAGIYHDFGLYFELRGSNDEAHRHYERALRVLSDAKIKDGMAQLYSSIGGLYEKTGNPRAALEAYSTGLAIAENTGEFASQVTHLTNIGLLHLGEDRLDECLKYLKMSIDLNSMLGNPKGFVYAYVNMGLAYRRLGKLDLAMDYYLRGLDQARSVGEQYALAWALHRVAECYLSLEDYHRAIKHIEECRSIVENRFDRSWLAEVLGTAALAYRHLHEFDKAQQYVQRSLEIHKMIGSTEGIGKDNFIIGLIHTQRRQFDEALPYFDAAEKLGAQTTQYATVAEARLNIGLCHLARHRYGQARDHLMQALSMAELCNRIEVKRDACKGLSDAAHANGDHVAAFKYHVRFTALRDSVLREQNRQSINEITARYEFDLKNQRITILEQEQSLQKSELARQAESLRLKALEVERMRQRNQLITRQHELDLLQLEKQRQDHLLTTTQLDLERETRVRREKDVILISNERSYNASLAHSARQVKNMLLILLVLLLVISYLTFKRIRAKKVEAALRAEAAEVRELAARTELERKESEFQKLYTSRLIEIEEQERRRLAGELHDGLGQELLVIENQAELALIDYNVLSARESLASIAERAKNVIVEVRRVSRNLRPVQLERAGLTETVRDTLHRIEASTGLHIQTDIENMDGCFSQDKEIHLFRIVQESISNILSHSHADAASVSVSRNDADVRIRIEDNGIGFDVSALTIRQDSERGFGLHGMRERVAMLGGTIAIVSNPGQGTTIDVRIPLIVDTERMYETPEVT
jgi:two-component system, NarL family, sensor kinase